MFSSRYSHAFDANERWNNISITEGGLYEWNSESTYVQEPPFLIAS